MFINKLPCLYVKRFELRMETALYKNKFIIIIINNTKTMSCQIWETPNGWNYTSRLGVSIVFL